MHPVFLDLDGFEIRWYGVLYAVAFAAGILFAHARARRAGRDPEVVLDLAFIALAGAVVGARLLYALVSPAEFIADPLSLFNLRRGGLVYLGGFVVGISGMVLYLRRCRLPAFEWLDLLLPSLPLGHAIGRIGCFMNGCCYGAPAGGFPGVALPALADGVARHPVQLYESFYNLLVVAVLLLFGRRANRRPGDVVLLYVALYSLGRFALEFLRGDDRGIALAGLPVSQALSLAGLVAASLLLALRARASAPPR